MRPQGIPTSRPAAKRRRNTKDKEHRLTWKSLRAEAKGRREMIVLQCPAWAARATDAEVCAAASGAGRRPHPAQPAEVRGQARADRRMLRVTHAELAARLLDHPGDC